MREIFADSSSMSATFKRFGWGESRQYLAIVGAHLTQLSHPMGGAMFPAGLTAGGIFWGPVA